MPYFESRQLIASAQAHAGDRSPVPRRVRPIPASWVVGDRSIIKTDQGTSGKIAATAAALPELASGAGSIGRAQKPFVGRSERFGPVWMRSRLVNPLDCKRMPAGSRKIEGFRPSGRTLPAPGCAARRHPGENLIQAKGLTVCPDACLCPIRRRSEDTLQVSAIPAGPHPGSGSVPSPCPAP